MTIHSAVKRSSYTLPADLVERAMRYAKPLGLDTVNGVLQAALEEFVAKQEAEAFEQALAEMAGDPAIVAENRQIAAEFAAADSDGLA